MHKIQAYLSFATQVSSLSFRFLYLLHFTMVLKAAPLGKSFAFGPPRAKVSRFLKLGILLTEGLYSESKCDSQRPIWD